MARNFLARNSLARNALAAILGDLRDLAAAIAFMGGVACLGLALAGDAGAMTIIQPPCPAPRLDAAWQEGFGAGLAVGLATGCAALLVLALAVWRFRPTPANPFDDNAAEADHPDVAAAFRARWKPANANGEGAARRDHLLLHVLAPLGALAFAAAVGVDLLLRSV